MFSLPEFKPKLIFAVMDYSFEKLISDVFAGITVGVVALPLAIAFSIASGMRPEAGIYTAIIGGFLVSALGGSMVQIGGPAGAFIVIIYGVIEQYGVANLQLATMLAGIILIIMGVFKVGALIRHIPVSLVIGFTNGIAVLIALSQVKDFMGLPGNEAPAEFIGKLQYIAGNINQVDSTTILVGLACLSTIIFWPKTYQSQNSKILSAMSRVPGTIMAAIVGIVMVRYFHINVATIGTRFGGIPQELPSVAIPISNWQSVRHIIPPAITIALLCSIESLLCARVADGMIVSLQSLQWRNGHREFRRAPVRRVLRYRRHRANRGQYPLGRPDTGRRNCSLDNAFADCIDCGAIGPRHPHVGPGGNPALCFIQYGRVA